MKCSEFQKIIPDIIDNTVPYEQLRKVLEHIGSCKDCYDELEIHYVLKYGLSDSQVEDNMDYIGHLAQQIKGMNAKMNRFETNKAIYILTQISAYTAVLGALIYVIFKYFLR